MTPAQLSAYLRAREDMTPAQIAAELDAASSIKADDESSVRAINAAEYIVHAPPPVDTILDGLFEAGDKVPIIGSSKARKSFFALQMALALAAGHKKFLAWDIPKPRRVLLAQMEITSGHFHRRVNHLAFAMCIQPEQLDQRLFIANLRGITITPDLIKRLAGENAPEVVILDPLYKVLQGDENKAEDMKPTLAMFDALANALGCAVVYPHHNGKGTAGDRDVRDRGAGSGVLLRDADASIYLTEHRDAEESELDGLCVIRALTRNFAPIPPFSAAWECGMFQVQAGEVVERTTKNKHSARARGLPQKIAELSQEHPSLSVREIAKKLKCGRSTVSDWLPSVTASG